MFELPSRELCKRHHCGIMLWEMLTLSFHRQGRGAQNDWSLPPRIHSKAMLAAGTRLPLRTQGTPTLTVMITDNNR